MLLFVIFHGSLSFFLYLNNKTNKRSGRVLGKFSFFPHCRIFKDSTQEYSTVLHTRNATLISLHLWI